MKKTGCILASVLVLLLLVVFFITGVPDKNFWRAKKLSSAIAQQLPIGSSKSQVLTFLRKEKVEYSYIDDNFDSASIVEEADLKPSQLVGFAIFTVRKTSWGFIFYRDTQFVFFFGKSDKLIKIAQFTVTTTV
ncbi:MAG: hypothetical protein ABI210_14485 [Abditibacteriaceae bacterium]